MFNTIGVCGTGNMGQAIVKGLVDSKAIAADHIYLYNIHREKAAALAKETGAVVVDSPLELAKLSQGLIMAVKPNMMKSAIDAVYDGLSSDTVLISIAAGLSLESLAGYAGQKTKIIRVMPNTPAMVGEGMASISSNDKVTAEETADAVDVFSSFGKAEVVDEKLIDAVCGLSGSGPAYVYLFIEALADGAVREGMPRQMAYTFAAQTVLGAAKMVLETGTHPGALKDAVCSPGGTTIEAVQTLEEGGFRAAVMKAVSASAEKNRNL
ncbi:pyrroline-5-carboxylate reductase [uncultured Megasphaera sp.]|uniref:pyrroline-5-carboxylate reductase n=1 Tax=uncultured Megasphaera sp. TaxID=165188 RepID=UPI0025EA5CB9|nr:pyrroline-5-carboxylate reductase [uncultured Megasphaera sp.]